MKTIFDEFIFKLKASKGNQSKLQRLIHFFNICRIHYIKMQANITQNNLIQINPLESETYLDGLLETIDIRVTYEHFISDLSKYNEFNHEILGRIPKDTIIRFYRNKVIEHANENRTFDQRNYQVVIQNGKIPVPILYGSSTDIRLPIGRLTGKDGEIIIPEIVDQPRKDFEALKGAFKNEGVVLPEILDSEIHSWNIETMKKISLAVEELISKDESFCMKRGERKYLNLLNALSKYGYPLPITSLEDYAQELITWGEEILKNVDQPKQNQIQKMGESVMGNKK